MSWYGNTLIPVVQDTFFDCESFPVDPNEVADQVSDPQVAAYIRKAYTPETIGQLYETCGLVERREQVERHNICWK